MLKNQKLTKVIAGRTVRAAMAEPGAVLVVFDDLSSMKTKLLCDRSRSVASMSC
jgi:hypothetical protein